ncbi:MAG: nuclear transport factor 2 family protein [Armatimonadota bacterium]
MIELDPVDRIEVERVALEYAEAFRTADVEAATALTILPQVDCLDLGSRSGIYIMDGLEFGQNVAAHANESFTQETKSVVIEAMGKNAALARFEAVLRKPDGSEAEIEWVEFLARTDAGWKIWANWLGPLPEGF